MDDGGGECLRGFLEAGKRMGWVVWLGLRGVSEAGFDFGIGF